MILRTILYYYCLFFSAWCCGMRFESVFVPAQKESCGLRVMRAVGVVGVAISTISKISLSFV